MERLISFRGSKNCVLRDHDQWTLVALIFFLLSLSHSFASGPRAESGRKCNEVTHFIRRDVDTGIPLDPLFSLLSWMLKRAKDTLSLYFPLLYPCRIQCSVLTMFYVLSHLSEHSISMCCMSGIHCHPHPSLSLCPSLLFLLLHSLSLYLFFRSLAVSHSLGSFIHVLNVPLDEVLFFLFLSLVFSFIHS